MPGDQFSPIEKAERLCSSGNSTKAVEIYKDLSSAGNIKASSALHRLYAQAKCGVVENKKTSLEYLIIVANSGDSSASYSVGLHFLVGVGTKKDRVKAHQWLIKNRDTKLPHEQYRIATAHDLYGSVDTAKFWFEKAAKNNHLDALYYLGKIYLYGKGNTLTDHNKAIKYFKKGAESGDEACMEKLSFIYGLRQNKEQEIFWLEKAAQNNRFFRTQLSLGQIYFNEKNFKKAAYWIEKAHLNGSSEAKEYWDKNNLWKYKE